jgi:mannosyl-oligosaccharide alpha-1,2-mannosidase
LTQDQLYLARSVDLADRLMSAFVTPSGLPVTMVNLAKRSAVPDTNNGNLVSSAEVGTLQLEFRYLSRVTGNDTYWEAAENVCFPASQLLADLLHTASQIMKVIERALPSPPLVSIFMRYFICSPLAHLLNSPSPETGQFMKSAIRLGSRADSLYEYLL